MPKVAAVIPARNEEKFIGETLSHLLSQDMKPSRVIVVNDGSNDGTKDVAQGFPGVEVVDLQDRGHAVLANPALAHVVNQGLKKLDKNGSKESDADCDYIMILGADDILPPNYVSEIVGEMEKDKTIAICSGQLEGEGNRKRPTGSGRIVRAQFWREIGLHYPTNYGFETYLVIKALQCGHKIKVMNNLLSKSLRKTGANYSKNTFIARGKALKALGYTQSYALGTIVIFGLRNPKAAYYMAKGYSSKDVELYDDDFRQFFRKVVSGTSLRSIVNHTIAVIFKHQM
jgi:glycosyltransferase involved in cell wall biosynthesis